MRLPNHERLLRELRGLERRVHRSGKPNKTGYAHWQKLHEAANEAREREAVELAVAKRNVEQHLRDATLKALNEAEHGWRKAIDKIGERANLT